MLITAVVIGLLTAYYFGIRFGVYAAVGSSVVLIAALVVPSIRWTVYGGVALFVVGVVVLGPRIGKPMGNIEAVRYARKGLGWVRSRLGAFKK
ncbi:MAG: hypothetical protein KJO07_08315 [Deltaproteobacteria bacterium]|jgi:hypothetical protein|nr:hypothetical protein [Deltaproteobacteria bacterium]